MVFLVKIGETKSIKDLDIIGTNGKLKFRIYYNALHAIVSLDEVDAEKLVREIMQWMDCLGEEKEGYRQKPEAITS